MPATEHYSGLLTHAPADVLTAQEWTDLADILSAQFEGGLETQSKQVNGMVLGGAVTYGGVPGQVSISVPFLAIVKNTTRMEALYTSTSPQTVAGIPNNATRYVFANVTATSVYDHLPTFSLDTVDTETTGRILLARAVADAGGAITVTDRRIFVPAVDAQNRVVTVETDVANIKTYIGTDYTDGTPPPTLDSRLDALEGTLAPSLLSTVQTGVPITFDFPELRDLKISSRLVHLDPKLVSDVPLMMLAVPGIWGTGETYNDGTTSPNYYSASSTTTKDTVNRRFG